MSHYGIITISWEGTNVIFKDVLTCIKYDDGVAVLVVVASFIPENLYSIISNGIRFDYKDGAYVMEFIPTQLIQAA